MADAELTLEGFYQRLTGAEGGPARLAHEDALRIFTRAKTVDWEGIYADHGFGDLDGDGAGELLVEISAGWQGDWRHDFVFVGDAERGWQRVADLRRDDSCNGPTVPRPVSVEGRRLLLCGGPVGSGTGYLASAASLFEWHGDRLAAVCSWTDYLEQAGWGSRMWVTASAKEPRFETAADGGFGIVVELCGDGGPEDSIGADTSAGFQVELRFLQREAGGPAALIAPGFTGEEPDLFTLVARAWLAEHEAFAWEVAKSGQEEQRETLRRLLSTAMPDPIAAPLQVALSRADAAGG